MTFRTYNSYSKKNDYLFVDFLPSISYEGFKHSQKVVQFSWLIFGFQIRW